MLKKKTAKIKIQTQGYRPVTDLATSDEENGYLPIQASLLPESSREPWSNPPKLSATLSASFKQGGVRGGGMITPLPVFAKN